MRARINERLERAARFPVTLIAAPAGFGKSVALRDFLAAHDVGAIVYEVRREDGTLLSFVRRLSEALEPVAPSAIASFPAMQERVMAADEPVRQIADWFIEHLRSVSSTIVIDDLQFAAGDPASIALLADLVERTSERIKWLIAARSDVGLPVATWIAYGRMDIPVGEDDLRFTTDEALAAASLADSAIEPQEIEALRHLTEGWPVALTIALRTRTHSKDLRSASSGTREMIYRYLAEQVFASLTSEQHAFAKATCVFSTFDAAIAKALGYSFEFLAAMRSSVAFLNEAAPGEYRYHDLFRDFLETELRRAGDDDWSACLRRGAAILAERGDAAGALRLYEKAGAFDRMIEMLESQGHGLFERGESELVASMLDAIPETRIAKNAALLGLRAMIEAGRGHYELSDHAFVAAIDLAGDEPHLRARLVQRYSTERVRRGLDCIELLEPFAAREDLDADLRSTILGTLATAYMQKSQQDEALTTMEAALRIAAVSTDDTVRARILQQAAYVNSYSSAAVARGYAERAIEIALKRDMYEIAARAYSILYSITSEEGDVITALSILDKLGECARKSASSQARLFALVASYDLEVERGNALAIEHLDPFLRETRALYPLAYAQGLLPADAFRAAASGDFRTAYQLLSDTADAERDGERRALRWAEIALYAAAAGLPAQAESACSKSAHLLADTVPQSRRAFRAHIFLAIAELLRGHYNSVHQRLSLLERAARGPNANRLRSMADAVRALYRVRLEQTEHASVDAALDRLRREHFGGLAELVAALPVTADSVSGYSALTVAEREVLHLLVRGASTKEIAEKTHRSPHTVDTHVRSLCRKLRCSGRREAIALATSEGWVQS